jgi:hypothetical protein
VCDIVDRRGGDSAISLPEIVAGPKVKNPDSASFEEVEFINEIESLPEGQAISSNVSNVQRETNSSQFSEVASQSSGYTQKEYLELHASSLDEVRIKM